MKYYGYIYKTINLINNKVYIGKRQGTFTQEYLGSGIHLHRAIKKYSTYAFHVELITYAITNEELDRQEKKCIKKYRELLGKENVYNITDGGDGGNTFEGKHHSKKSKKKISIANIGRIFSEEAKQRMSKSQKTRIRYPHSEKTKKKIGEGNRGKIVSMNTKIKMSNAKKGKKQSIESNKKRSATLKNRIFSTEWRRKISLSRLGCKHTPETILKMSLSKLGKTNKLKGRTYKEIYGKKRAKEILNRRVKKWKETMNKNLILNKQAKTNKFFTNRLTTVFSGGRNEHETTNLLS